MKPRFRNLDALRFFAALIVLIVHLEILKTSFGLPSLKLKAFLVSSHIAVTFFFVLSGFLIASQLFEQKKKMETISLRNFYKKRIKRIFPLYYLLVFLNFFIFLKVSDFSLPDTQDALNFFYKKFIFCLLFFPNYAELKFGNIEYVKISWTLAVEMFFYLFLPILIKYTNEKKMRVVLCCLLLFCFIISAPISWPVGDKDIMTGVNFYLARYRLYAFAIGVIAAYLYAYQRDYFSQGIFKSKLFGYTYLIFISILLLSGVTFSIINHQLYSFLFGVLIISLCLSGINPFLLNNRFVVYLGKISYGIYLFHPPVIVFLLHNWKGLFIVKSYWSLFFCYIFVSGVVIIISLFLYEFFEKNFFTVVKTAVYR